MRMLIALVFVTTGIVLSFYNFSDGLLCYIVAVFLDIADTLVRK